MTSRRDFFYFDGKLQEQSTISDDWKACMRPSTSDTIPQALLTDLYQMLGPQHTRRISSIQKWKENKSVYNNGTFLDYDSTDIFQGYPKFCWDSWKCLKNKANWCCVRY